jgi:hypothetical protein
LVQVPIGGQQGILYRIFGVSRIAQKPIGDAVKIWKAA